MWPAAVDAGHHHHGAPLQDGRRQGVEGCMEDDLLVNLIVRYSGS